MRISDWSSDVCSSDLNRQQYEKVLGFIDDARKNGTIVAGGNPIDREGYFIEPTIVRDISPDSRLVREEQFGPVLPVLSYSNIADVIAAANSSERTEERSVGTECGRKCRIRGPADH